MRKSQTVALTLMSGLVSACASEPDYKLAERRCVDADNRVVADTLCRQVRHASGVGIVPFIYPYHFYYGGNFSGGRVMGGSVAPHYYTPTRTGAYSSRNTVSRGGFGTSARSFSSGRGFTAGG
jgi:hypothetical protein